MKVQCLLLEMPIHHDKKDCSHFVLLKRKYFKKTKKKENSKGKKKKLKMYFYLHSAEIRSASAFTHFQQCRQAS